MNKAVRDGSNTLFVSLSSIRSILSGPGLLFVIREWRVKDFVGRYLKVRQSKNGINIIMLLSLMLVMEELKIALLNTEAELCNALVFNY